MGRLAFCIEKADEIDYTVLTQCQVNVKRLNWEYVSEYE